MKKFMINLLDGMGHIKLFPDERSVDDILKDYHSQTEMKFMLLGFILIMVGIIAGTITIINDHEAIGLFLALSSIFIWSYAVIRKRKQKDI
jgi:hypothetical protein